MAFFGVIWLLIHLADFEFLVLISVKLISKGLWSEKIISTMPFQCLSLEAIEIQVVLVSELAMKVGILYIVEGGYLLYT